MGFSIEVAYKNFFYKAACTTEDYGKVYLFWVLFYSNMERNIINTCVTTIIKKINQSKVTLVA